MYINKKAQISLEALYFIIIVLILIAFLININLKISSKLKENKIQKEYFEKLDIIIQKFILNKNIILKENNYEYKKSTNIYI
jgi:hypothetical protein